MAEVLLKEAAGPGRRGAREVVDEICRRETSGAVRCARLPGKGCVLLAGRRFRQGEEILVEPPLLRVAEPPQTPAFQALEELCERRAAELPLAPLWHCVANEVTLTPDKDSSTRKQRCKCRGKELPHM